DNRALVENADMVVVNGGVSAGSESFSMRQAVGGVPPPHHTEQRVKPPPIEHPGGGKSAQEARPPNALSVAPRQRARPPDGYRKLGEIPDGAAQAAKLIMSTVTSKSGVTA